MKCERFELSDELDNALYMNIPLFFPLNSFLCIILRNVMPSIPIVSTSVCIVCSSAVKKPYFHEQLKNVTVKENESVKLECHFSAEPSPQLQWLHNDNPIQSSPAFRVSTFIRSLSSSTQQ